MHWVPPIITSAASANLFELAALSVIWLLWLVGCVVSTVCCCLHLRLVLPGTDSCCWFAVTEHLAQSVVLLPVRGMPHLIRDDGLRMARLDRARRAHCPRRTGRRPESAPRTLATDGRMGRKCDLLTLRTPEGGSCVRCVCGMLYLICCTFLFEVDQQELDTLPLLPIDVFNSKHDDFVGCT